MEVGSMKRQIVISLLVMGFVASAQTGRISLVPVYPPNGIFSATLKDQYVFTTKLDEYVLAFPALEGGGAQRRVEIPITFPSQVAPRVKASIEKLSDGAFSYAYTVMNEPGARTAMESFGLAVRSLEALNLIDPIAGPFGWTMEKSRDVERHLGPIWRTGTHLAAGGDPVTFRFRSVARPGLTTAVFRGPRANGAFLNSLPASARAQFLNLEAGPYSGQRRLLVGPRYPEGVNPVVVAADLFESTQTLQEKEQETPYMKAVRGQLREYMDSVAKAFQLVEDNTLRPVLNINAAPATEMELMIQSVIDANLR
jgi:hypothetical protein